MSHIYNYLSQKGFLLIMSYSNEDFSSKIEELEVSVRNQGNKL